MWHEARHNAHKRGSSLYFPWGFLHNTRVSINILISAVCLNSWLLTLYCVEPWWCGPGVQEELHQWPETQAGGAGQVGRPGRGHTRQAWELGNRFLSKLTPLSLPPLLFPAITWSSAQIRVIIWLSGYHVVTAIKPHVIIMHRTRESQFHFAKSYSSNHLGPATSRTAEKMISSWSWWEHTGLRSLTDITEHNTHFPCPGSPAKLGHFQSNFSLIATFSRITRLFVRLVPMLSGTKESVSSPEKYYWENIQRERDRKNNIWMTKNINVPLLATRAGRSVISST